MAADEKPFLRVVREDDAAPPSPTETTPSAPTPSPVPVEPPPAAAKVIESEYTRALREKLGSTDASLRSAAKFAAIGMTIVGGAVELGRGKPAEAVRAWVGAHTVDVDRVRLGGVASTYEKMDDLKEAVLAAAEELDAANAPSLSSALYAVVGRIEQIAAPLPPPPPTFWGSLRDLYWYGADVLRDVR